MSEGEPKSSRSHKPALVRAEQGVGRACGARCQSRNGSQEPAPKYRLQSLCAVVGSELDPQGQALTGGFGRP
jgi:hypothetical protein